MGSRTNFKIVLLGEGQRRAPIHAHVLEGTKQQCSPPRKFMLPPICGAFSRAYPVFSGWLGGALGKERLTRRDFISRACACSIQPASPAPHSL